MVRVLAEVLPVWVETVSFEQRQDNPYRFCENIADSDVPFLFFSPPEAKLRNLDLPMYRTRPISLLSATSKAYKNPDVFGEAIESVEEIEKKKMSQMKIISNSHVSSRLAEDHTEICRQSAYPSPKLTSKSSS